MVDGTEAIGGNIQLTGFRRIEPSEMVVVKKMVGRCAKRFSEICSQFESLHITLKPVHEKEKSEKYELHALLVDRGKQYNAEITERNLFFAIDALLKKIENEVGGK